MPCQKARRKYTKELKSPWYPINTIFMRRKKWKGRERWENKEKRINCPRMTG